MNPLPLFERLGVWVLIAITFYALGRDLYAGDWGGAGVAVFGILMFSALLWTPQETERP